MNQLTLSLGGNAQVTKHQLFTLLAHNGTAVVRLPDGREGTLQSIERECGSGSSFNLRVYLGCRPMGAGLRVPYVESVYVLTVD